MKDEITKVLNLVKGKDIETKRYMALSDAGFDVNWVGGIIDFGVAKTVKVFGNSALVQLSSGRTVSYGPKKYSKICKVWLVQKRDPNLPF